jgi:hypothetical protein
MNKLLNKKEFENYQGALGLLQTHCAEMLSRKIPEANIQQAFTLQTTLDLIPTSGNLLSAGCWEDTATETLKKVGYNVIDVDPQINTDLKTYFDNNPSMHGKLDGVVSTSVIEHVERDEEFIDCIFRLTKSLREKSPKFFASVKDEMKVRIMEKASSIIERTAGPRPSLIAKARFGLMDLKDIL